MPGGTGYEKYSKAELRALVSRYLTLGDFIKAHHGEYRYILSHKWHDILHERGFNPREGKMPKIPDTLGEIVEKINRGDLTQTGSRENPWPDDALFPKIYQGHDTSGYNHAATPCKPSEYRRRPARETGSTPGEARNPSLQKLTGDLIRFLNSGMRKPSIWKVKRWGLYHDASDLLKGSRPNTPVAWPCKLRFTIHRGAW